MKIGIVTEYYYPSLGGITEHVHHFALEAKRQGHEPVIITGNAGLDPDINSHDLEIIRLGKSVPIYSNASVARVTIGFGVGKKLHDIFKSENFDIIHIHAPFVPMLPGLAQRYSNTTTVATFHTQFDSSFFLKLVRKNFQQYFNNLDGRIAVSKLCIESMAPYFRGEFRVIPNGVDIEKFNCDAEKISKFDDDKLNIFFLSRLEPRNGLEYLIKAFTKIRRVRDDCRLIVGGDGPLMKYFKSLVPGDVASDVHFIGRIDGVRPNYYSTADIFCFPTTKASFGITVLEAMASSKPVVAFSIPAYKGIIETGQNGILCGNPGEDNLLDALCGLLDSRDKRKRYGEEARQMSKKYSWTAVSEKVLNYYEEIRKNS